ncbi:MAG: outer membrane beta-barrel protein [Bdellovibrionaceae bacterium]|nr:outer membrane beta-barrel protein [Pseudobdellovibrionaceae bacterium]
MNKFIFIIASLFMVSANAQTFGLQAGVHHTTADTDATGLDKEAETNFRVGMLAMFDLTGSVDLRTGLTYTTRHATWSSSGIDVATLEFAYLDIPVLFQFHITEVFSLYGGPVVAINMDKGVKDASDAEDVESLYILGQVGGNFMFDGIGFDIYLERGFGEFIGDDGGTQAIAKDYTSIGANFVLLF